MVSTGHVNRRSEVDPGVPGREHRRLDPDSMVAGVGCGQLCPVCNSAFLFKTQSLAVRGR